VANLRYCARALGRFVAVSFGEQGNRMDCPEHHALLFGAIDELKQASGISRCDDTGTGGANVL
jgi:hypothetical protein